MTFSQFNLLYYIIWRNRDQIVGYLFLVFITGGKTFVSPTFPLIAIVEKVIWFKMIRYTFTIMYYGQPIFSSSRKGFLWAVLLCNIITIKEISFLPERKEGEWTSESAQHRYGSVTFSSSFSHSRNIVIILYPFPRGTKCCKTHHTKVHSLLTTTYRSGQSLGTISISREWRAVPKGHIHKS